MVSVRGARNLLNSPYNRDNMWQAIGVLTISPEAGKLNPVELNWHQTWWPTKEFNPSEDCRSIR